MIQDGTFGDTANRQENTPVDGSDSATGEPPTEDEAAEQQPADSPETQQLAEQPELPLDVTFEILKNSRRRIVLEYLRDADDTVTIGELAEHIAAIENDTTVQQLNAQQRKRVYIGLYQCHLPKMDDSNVVEFNQDRGLVTVTPASEQLYEYLDTSDEPAAAETPHRYLVFTALTAVGFLLAQLAGAYIVATVVVLGFLGAFAAHSVREYQLRDED